MVGEGSKLVGARFGQVGHLKIGCTSSGTRRKMVQVSIILRDGRRLYKLLERWLRHMLKWRPRLSHLWKRRMLSQLLRSLGWILNELLLSHHFLLLLLLSVQLWLMSNRSHLTVIVRHLTVSSCYRHMSSV